ncbi:hypothetical protein FACS1894217_15850 [Clostridia bacterium]|nr:hypothetical protein FACS1894217_15850 [Clostridia bacterium]
MANFNEMFENMNTLANLAVPNSETISALTIRDYKMADYQYEVIMERIKDFEDELDDEHEVAVQLASFGKDILLNVTDIGYSNPHTLVFHGFVNGQNATLIQNMSMLSFLLLAVKKQEPTKPPRRIGFYVEDEKE